VTIFFNAEPFLDEAVQSVLSQSYDDWELILVDDGSSDGSTEIARRYSKFYRDRIRVMSHDRHSNRGMSASRNLGIGAARGDYIGFLDAGDVWLQEKLEEQVELLDRNWSVAMLYGVTERWFSWSGRTEDIERDFVRPIPFGADRVVHAPELLRPLLRQESMPCIGSVLARKPAIESVGGFEEEFRTMYEDQVFFTKMMLAFPIFVSALCWDRYRNHGNSSCAVAVKSGDDGVARKAFLSFVCKYLVKTEITDKEIWTLLRQEMRESERVSMPLRWRSALARLRRLNPSRGGGEDTVGVGSKDL
jgi:glycosyltransferase involved in cell wall biosynthesis